MEIFFNKDSSFFNIESPDLVFSPGVGKSVTKLISESMLSFSVTEELGKITMGKLHINDNDQIYSRIFRNGMKFQLSWGYKQYGQNLSQASLGTKDPNELTGAGDRRGLECIIQSPGGSGSAGGVTDYNVTFYGDEYLGTKVRAVFTGITRKQVVEQLFLKLNIVSTFIDFESSSDMLTNSTSIRQWETDFNLLLRLANEWKSMFITTFSPSGAKMGLFIDPQKLDSQKVKSFIKISTGSIKGYLRTLYYNDGERSNVKSYTWKHNVGVSGQGDRVELKLINGRVVTHRYIAKTQDVTTYRLNMVKINKKYASKNAADRAALVKNATSVKTLPEAEWGFDAIESKTAPQGMGIEASVQMIGDPLLALPMEARFVGNFPALLQQSRGLLGDLTRLFFRKITHNFTKSGGYQVTADIADAYTITGSAIAPPGRV